MDIIVDVEQGKGENTDSLTKMIIDVGVLIAIAMGEADALNVNESCEVSDVASG